MAGPFKMKNPLLSKAGKTGESIAGNYASPARHGVVGEDGKRSYRGHSHKGMSLSQRLGSVSYTHLTLPTILRV